MKLKLLIWIKGDQAWYFRDPTVAARRLVLDFSWWYHLGLYGIGSRVSEEHYSQFSSMSIVLVYTFPLLEVMRPYPVYGNISAHHIRRKYLFTLRSDEGAQNEKPGFASE
jgi:hypothetical protein